MSFFCYTYVGDFMERLAKFIANSGYTSRRKAEELIKEGKVVVNGEIISELGTKVSGNDKVIVEGKMLNNNIKKVYYLLNKPRGVISSVNDEHNRTTVVDLINTSERIYPVGRLDYDTTGLLILTNDGELANILMHPKNEVEKTYIAKIRGILDSVMLNKLKKGVEVDKRKVVIKSVKVKKIDKEKNTSLVELSIVEGRNHIVKNIFKVLGYDVMKLTRTNYGFLNLDGLKSGEYRNLTLKEVKKLYSLNTK